MMIIKMSLKLLIVFVVGQLLSVKNKTNITW